MSDATARAHAVIALLNQRAVGHTSMAQVGYDNFRGDAILIAHTMHAARDFAQHRTITRDSFRTAVAGLDSLSRTAGLRGAVSIDNYALNILLKDLVQEIARKDGQIAAMEAWQA